MEQSTSNSPFSPTEKTDDVITEICRNGARRMLAAALEAEVAEYVSRFRNIVDENGHRMVTRNGHARQRSIVTGIGTVSVRQPRVNDRRVDENGERMAFTSKILPPYLRKTKAIEAFIPWLYLKGVSTGDMADALAALIGPAAAEISATTVARLTKTWQAEFDAWNARDLSGKRYVVVPEKSTLCSRRQ